MDRKLFTAALMKFAAGVMAIGLLLFLPAGSLGWWQGWMFMGILFVPMFVAGLIMRLVTMRNHEKAFRENGNRLTETLTRADGCPISHRRF